jgi:hypothetical protein
MCNMVKARKDYKCDQCEGDIKKDDYYEFGKGRGPAYDKDCNEQIGIHYWQYRLCSKCVHCQCHII